MLNNENESSRFYLFCTITSKYFYEEVTESTETKYVHSSHWPLTLNVAVVSTEPSGVVARHVYFAVSSENVSSIVKVAVPLTNDVW